MIDVDLKESFHTVPRNAAQRTYFPIMTRRLILVVLGRCIKEFSRLSAAFLAVPFAAPVVRKNFQSSCPRNMGFSTRWVINLKGQKNISLVVTTSPDVFYLYFSKLEANVPRINKLSDMVRFGLESGWASLLFMMAVRHK